MVLITFPKAAAFLAAIIIPATIPSGLSLDDDLDFAARGYDDDALSVREYIDTQIELALRDYQDSLEELFARHTREEIASKVAEWRRKLAEVKPLLKPAVNARKAAEKAHKANPNDENLKTMYKKAKQEEAGIRGSVEHAEDEFDFWQKLKPSRSPSPSASPKGKM